MNTLTKNRILEMGDEYLHNGQWMPVPEVDWGLQLIFTKYQQVRRPREQPCAKAPDKGQGAEPEINTVTMVTPAEAVTVKVASPDRVAESHKRVMYSDLSSMPNWTGRNGTFKARALNLYRTKDGLIQIIPEGTRGQARNALIEVPVKDLTQITDWLLQQQLAAELKTLQ